MADETGDKPHLLLYDLCCEADRLIAQVNARQAELQRRQQLLDGWKAAYALVGEQLAEFQRRAAAQYALAIKGDTDA